MESAISTFDFLSMEERRLLHSLLQRVAENAPRAVIDIQPETPAGKHRFFVSFSADFESFGLNDSGRDLTEFNRRLAHPEEFIKVGSVTIDLE